MLAKPGYILYLRGYPMALIDMRFGALPQVQNWMKCNSVEKGTNSSELSSYSMKFCTRAGAHCLGEDY